MHKTVASVTEFVSRKTESTQIFFPNTTLSLVFRSLEEEERKQKAKPDQLLGKFLAYKLACQLDKELCSL